MFTTILLTLAVASTPANDPNTGATAASAAAKSAQTTAATPARKPASYCVIDTLTGSRIPYKTCKTREQWMAQGFDPLTVK